MHERKADFKQSHSQSKCESCETPPRYNKLDDIVTSILITILAVAVIKTFDIEKIFRQVNSDNNTGLWAMFILGIVASISSCGATVGALLISLNQKWDREGLKNTIVFLLSRIIIFSLVGAILGAVGSILKVSILIICLSTIAVSIFMLFMAYDILGFRFFSVFKPRTSNLVKKGLEAKGNQITLFAVFFGALTILLPCGFTLSAFGIAALSKNAINGLGIMLSFVIGSSLALLLLVIIGKKLLAHERIGNIFGKVIGVMILIFSVTNISNQLRILNLQNIFTKTSFVSSEGKAQILKMEVNEVGYEPSKFTVKVGRKVVWEITKNSAGGCTSALIAPGLFEDQVLLTNAVTIKEFTPQKIGKYNFSCWMGMVSGTIDVVE